MAIRIIPLGGLGEVGKNMTVYQSGGEAIVVDAGLAFPRDEHLGVDLVLPDSVALAIRAEGKLVVHTGDYKLDHTPVDGMKTDVGRLAELGNEGVDLLLGDSTNAERPGMTPSERLVGEAFRQIIPLRQGRVLVSSFASNVHRMQQAIDVAVSVGRKVCVVGRSMRKNVNIARNLGYMDVPDDVLVRPPDLEELPPHEQLILCTGSQGEPLSALTRIAYRDHPAVSVERGDTVIISAKPIPGNELRVHDALRDRRHLSEHGVLIIVATLASTNGGEAGPPELIARGFMEPDGALIDEMRFEAGRVLRECLDAD